MVTYIHTDPDGSKHEETFIVDDQERQDPNPQRTHDQFGMGLWTPEV